MFVRSSLELLTQLKIETFGISSHWACRLMGHVISWGMSSTWACHLMGYVFSWGMTSHGACLLMGHAVSWGMSSHGACRLMGHVVSWGISSYGACRHMGHVVLWGMLSYGAGTSLERSTRYLLRVWQPLYTARLGATQLIGFLSWQWISGQRSRRSSTGFMIAAAAQVTVCVEERGNPRGFSEAPPAPMLLSNSLHPDVVPQMMAGIIMKWIMMDDADRAIDMEYPTGVSFWTEW